MGEMQVLEAPAVSAEPVRQSLKPTKPKRRPPLSPGELTTIRELATAGASASEIAGKLDDRPTRTVRDAMRGMGFVNVPPQPPSEPLPESAPPKRSKPRHPFTPGERAAIERLARSGTPANEIAKLIRRGSNYSQVALLVRQLGLAKPTSVQLQVGASKANCPTKILDLLEAAARRQSVKPALLAVQLITGVLQHGSIDAVLRDDAAALVDDLRNVQLVLNLEAVGRANGACRDYRLRSVAVAHGERPG
jgi:hypothetical protein